MKCLSYFIILLLWMIPMVHAQEIDHERMNRDLDIMESILEELFKIEPTGGNIALIREALHGSNGVRGTYVPGYGVLFQVTPPTSSRVFIHFAGGDSLKQKGNVAYFGGSDEQALDTEAVKERIIEFLCDYGSTIDQLKESDHITVVFAGSSESGLVQHFNVARSLSHSSEQESRLPAISVTVQKLVLAAYNSGALSEEAFEQQLSISVGEKADEPSTDLKIMAGILEAAFEDKGKEHYQINGAVSYQQIEPFGALFSFDISYGNIYHALSFQMAHLAPLEDIDIDFDSTDWDSIDINGFNADALQKRMKQVNVRMKHVQKQFKQHQQVRKEAQAERTEKMKEALDDFLTTLKGYVIDYGGTLESVPAEQQLLFSITVNNAGAEIPGQIQLVVKKSVLEAVKGGQISREEAIEEISVSRWQ